MIGGFPVLSRDIEELPLVIQEELDAEQWTVTRNIRRFSSISIDHVHEQVNKRVEYVGGVIDLTENPVILERWIVTGSD